MRLSTLALAAATLTFGAAPPAAAQDADTAVKARQSAMTLMSFNIGPLVGMARGDIEYDADLAQAAADSLSHVAQIDHGRFWVEGTHIENRDDTEALPAIWDDPEDFASKLADLRDASAAMQEVAGDGLAAVQGELRNLGGSCGACHDNYRVSDD